MRRTLTGLGTVLSLTTADATVKVDPGPPPVSMAAQGYWAGEMVHDASGLKTNYPIKLLLHYWGGKFEYPSLNCSGTLKLVGDEGRRYAFYVEEVALGGYDTKTNNGCRGGAITAFFVGGELAWRWSSAWDGGFATAQGQLKRTRPKD